MPIEIRELNIKTTIADPKTAMVFEKVAAEVALLGKYIEALEKVLTVGPDGSLRIRADDVTVLASGRILVRGGRGVDVRSDAGLAVAAHTADFQCASSLRVNAGQLDASANTVQVTGRNSTTLTSGTAFLSLKANGQVTLSAGSTMDVKGAGMVNIKGAKVSTN
ncbi:MAG: hypothetical protein R2729_09740 [Bryobacteraceae bacterium]